MSLDLSDPNVKAFYNGLQEEWILVEGQRVEVPAKKLFASFTPISWSKPANFGLIFEDLATSGKTKQMLEYSPAPVEKTVSMAREVQLLVQDLDHPAKDALLANLDAITDGCLAFSEANETNRNDSLTAWSLKEYGAPSKATLEEAWSILTSDAHDPSEVGKMATREILEDIEKLLSTLPGDWNVITSDIQAAMMVKQSSRQLVVRTGLEITWNEVRRLAVHEIGGHIVRSLNSERTKGTLASLSLGADSISTEEGLAIWWEHQLAALHPNTLRRYAARAIAVDIALHAGASMVIQVLKPYVGQAEAASIALRVKRGMHDLESPGAFTKDHAYLSGYLEVATSLDGASLEWIRVLMSTKWGLSMMPVAKRLHSMGVLQPGNLPWEVCHGLARN
ncbi:tyrosine/phenylalanine carboxypeptidase domain-containing protein [Glutamicibacter sp. NPDC087344]|uniref:tyrosine/phenylalanine carboxypeptidase domain-containing protein n=1 Tax=Glutamicibacter sp. NPDC087344 TaxID=3363994 RepID=UPI0037F7D346